MTEETPAHLTDWKGNSWTPESGSPAAHPNARFTVPASQCPIIAPEWEDPKGVPISAILFGGRRASAVTAGDGVLRLEPRCLLDANVASEKTAAAEGKVGELRRDPFAMLPFCGYNMGDYMGHWIDVAKGKDQAKLPKIYYVNWFRKNDAGKFVWPGFGENSRVLKWIVDRLDGRAEGVETPIGVLPAKGALDTKGLDLSEADLDFLLTVDKDVWREEAALVPDHLNDLRRHTPKELWTSTARWCSAWASPAGLSRPVHGVPHALKAVGECLLTSRSSRPAAVAVAR
ncbi:phosphoenolpyruvate carboxykinase domain-containing protein [Streptomyces sp. L7]